MKYFAVMLPVLALVALPVTTDAHSRWAFMINGEKYDFVIGSLNEPLTVDDKTGLDLRISKATAPVTGLEESLKVEMIAGDARRTTDISPVYGTAGAYKNVFYPTIATTLSYRIFGTIAETPFDYTFTCNPAGHAVATDDTSEVKVSDSVTRLLQAGSFSCPTAKEDLGFPEKSVALAGFSAEVEKRVKRAKHKGMAGIGLSVLALALAGYAVMSRKNNVV